MVSKSVLMVCLGNICRSPLAHGIMAHLTQTLPVEVDSAGTASYHVGNPPDPRSIAEAAKHGVDISNQKARQFTPNDFKAFDHIFVMDRQNLKHVLAQASNEEEMDKVQLLLDDKEVEDPYYGGEEGFAVVYDKIFTACTNIISAWEKA